MIPLYVPLTEALPKTIEEAFRRASKPLGVRVFPRLLQEFLGRIRPVLILDGIDQIDSDAWNVSELEELASRCQVIVTGRADQAESSLQRMRGYAVLRVSSLSIEVARNALREYLSEEEQIAKLVHLIGRDRTLRAPLMLLLLIRASLEGKIVDGAQTHELLRYYVEVVYEYASANAGVRGGSLAVLLEVLAAT